MKTLKPGTMTTELFLKEAAVMKTCQHKHLVTLYAVCSVDEPILIVTELMPNGSLLSYLRDDIGSRLPLQVLFNMSSQVTRRFFVTHFVVSLGHLLLQHMPNQLFKHNYLHSLFTKFLILPSYIFLESFHPQVFLIFIFYIKTF